MWFIIWPAPLLWVKLEYFAKFWLVVETETTKAFQITGGRVGKNDSLQKLLGHELKGEPAKHGNLFCQPC